MTTGHSSNTLAATLLAAAALWCAAGAVQAQPVPPAAGGATAIGAQQQQWERRDMGVMPPRALHDGPFHGPTPSQIPGGQVITTQGLVPLLQQRELPVHVFHVLGGGQALPGAVAIPWASQGGSFDDVTQEQLGQLLRQLTRGRADSPLVFYCASAECWMSYNAAARAIRLGYRNVLWYRGGLEAWGRAGLPLGSANDGLAQAPAAPMPGAPMPGGATGRPPGALPPDAFGPGRRQ
jgi:PQQ-dependent catabolism-associated CXXCW motif protein